MNKQTFMEVGSTIISFILVIGGIFFIGYSVGNFKGYERHREDLIKIECEINNKNKPFNEVEAKCIKYFTEETK